MEIASTTLIATSTAIASSSANINEVPEWFSYTVDIILILIFLFILFFVKPDENLKKDVTEEEAPNPLEQVLKTDSKKEIESEANADSEQHN